MAYICPFCGIASVGDGRMSKTVYESFENSGISSIRTGDSLPVTLQWVKCPNCSKISFSLYSFFDSDNLNLYFSYPPRHTIPLPDYVPAAIQNDYLEAASIIDLSPKAAATLARRCLQGMIHDFWGINEKNLNAEITSLKGKVSAAQWNAIDGLRKVGNIGAHMEKDAELMIDIDPGEAAKLLKLIELLIQKWYVARHDEEQLLAEIAELADDKEEQRKPSTP